MFYTSFKLLLEQNQALFHVHTFCVDDVSSVRYCPKYVTDFEDGNDDQHVKVLNKVRPIGTN